MNLMIRLIALLAFVTLAFAYFTEDSPISGFSKDIEISLEKPSLDILQETFKDDSWDVFWESSLKFLWKAFWEPSLEPSWEEQTEIPWEGTNELQVELHGIIFDNYDIQSTFTLFMEGTIEISIYLMPGVVEHYDESSLIDCVRSLTCKVNDLILDESEYTLFIVNEKTNQILSGSVGTTVQYQNIIGMFLLGFNTLCICGFGLYAIKKYMNKRNVP